MARLQSKRFLAPVLCALLLAGASHAQTLNLGGSSTTDGGMSTIPGQTSGPDSIFKTDPSPVQGSLQCGASNAGPTCGGSGTASLPSSSSVDVGAGNPVNIVTGNKYQREVDLPALPGVLGLEIVRHYNSSYSGHTIPTGIFGRGWKLSYETELHAVGNSLQIIQADGARLIFSRDLFNPSLCATANPADGQIVIRKTPRGDEYLWTWTNGRKLSFNSRGKLVQIQAPTGEFVSLQHDPKGHLVQVTDPQGRSLHLRYLDPALGRNNDRFKGVVAIDSPVGQFKYEYGSALPKGATIDKIHVLANLVKVSLPTHYDANQKLHAFADRGVTSSSISRSYHYEDAMRPTLLTGITVSGSGSDGQLMHRRIVTWAYDIDGKAILSIKGEPKKQDKDGKDILGTGIEQVSFDRSAPGKVILTNSLGQTTTYRHAIIGGQHRLLEVLGPGCASCGETNIRYRYDRVGRLTDTIRLNDQGQPIHGSRTDWDGLGRPIRISRIAYRNGKPQQPQWHTRYQYAAHKQGEQPSYQPALIARPSVVPGKEHRIRIDYNEHGQPLKVTESGWSPAIDGGAASAMITRSTGYRYSGINGRSLLTQIDGPLPNGPKSGPEDSDIVRAEWDPSGNQVIAWTAPGNFRSRIDYDKGTGRLVRVVNAEGFSTTFDHDPFGRIERISSTGPGWPRPRIQSVKYDALGHPTESGSGSEAIEGYQPQWKQAFDASGNLLWQASALGILEQRRYDTESRLIESGQYSNSIAQMARVAYDVQGRIAEMADNRGVRIAIAYDSQGRPHRITDALGRQRSMAPSPASSPAAQHSSPRQVSDDFGRIVATISDDSGTVLRAFDQANRLTGNIDAQGNRAVYTYDVAGRIARQQITDKRTGQSTGTIWRYQGKHLIALEHPTQSEHYRYDARGLLIAKTVKQTHDDGSEVTSVTRYAYDDEGGLQSVSLPDGSVVGYERNGQGQVVEVTRSRLRTAWLKWLLPSRTLVKDIERDIVGVKRYATGNGIEALYQRSREGILGRMVYRPVSANAKLRTASSAVPTLLGITAAHAGETPSKGMPSANRLPGALGLPADVNALIDHRYLWDAQGNLLHVQDKGGATGTASYAYDHKDRLIAAVHTQQNTASISRYFHDQLGRRLLSQEGIPDQRDLSSHTRKAHYQGNTFRLLGDADTRIDYDVNGHPASAGSRAYVWDALGRLREVREQDKTLGRYTYNHRGERIAKLAGTKASRYLYEAGSLSAELDAKGKLTRQYLYLANQPIAVIDTPQGKEMDRGERDALEQAMHDLGTIVQAWLSDDERIVWLHANHLGAVEAASEQGGQLVWQASYQPFGQVKVSGNGFTLDLRLPGQIEDSETGLYYNRYRYYDPETGRYLTPDPLGTPDGPDPYAYVRGNPLRYIDPDGLILFAFDGTGNTNDQAWLNDNGSSFSNVWQFWGLYEDGNRRYVTGVGTVHQDAQYGDIKPSDYKPWYVPLNGQTADMGGNYSGPARIQRMIQYFNDEANLFADDNAAMDVDIVGFSRGAAQARDFANYIVAHSNNGWYSYKVKDANGVEVNKCQKVNFRFMGLYDTVLSTNYSGYSYQLGIPDAFAHVAQAVALNEYRGALTHPYLSTGAFPGESILQGMYTPVLQPGKTRIERGLIGAHADIGGGFGANDSQLSQVALAWMVQQAEAAGLKMGDSPLLHTIIANPVIHDKSGSILTGAPAPDAEDRIVKYGDGSTTKQREMPFSSGMSWADTQQFIQYLPEDDPQRPNFITGTVDMKAYLEWLNKNGYDIKLTVQGS